MSCTRKYRPSLLVSYNHYYHLLILRDYNFFVVQTSKVKFIFKKSQTDRDNSFNDRWKNHPVCMYTHGEYYYIYTETKSAAIVEVRADEQYSPHISRRVTHLQRVRDFSKNIFVAVLNNKNTSEYT